MLSILKRLAVNQGRADDVLNQELARELAEKDNREDIKEIAAGLWDKDKNIQSDCIKVIYEVGYLKPELISDYIMDFLKLLKNRDNRMVWGAMIAIAAVSEIKADIVYDNLDSIYCAMGKGSVITIDNGIKALSRTAAKNESYNEKIFPYLIEHLKKCRPKEIPQHSESILTAVNDKNKQEFLDAIKERENLLTEAQLKRVKKIHKLLGDD